jgi:23S rRNA pseudouridine1911/1915/1917 synthase
MTIRIFTVGRGEAGQTVADFLRRRLTLPHAAVSDLVRGKQVRIASTACLNPTRRVQPGQRVEVRLPAGKPEKKRPSANRKRKSGVTAEIRHLDEHIVVVEKPAGLTTMRHAEDVAEFGRRAQRYLPPTLADLLPALIAGNEAGRPGPVLAVHRIDNETSGLVVFARTKVAERHLGKQFRAHSTERLYLALVRGKARSGRIESSLVRDRGDGRRGSTRETDKGQRAVTHVRVIEELGDFTLVECRLETGRTHQVRIHLGEAGTPLCGEHIYDRPVHGKPLPDGSGAARILLHAATLGFDHPATGERMHWTSPLPRDMSAAVERLRGNAGQRTPGG